MGPRELLRPNRTKPLQNFLSPSSSAPPPTPTSRERREPEPEHGRSSSSSRGVWDLGPAGRAEEGPGRVPRPAAGGAGRDIRREGREGVHGAEVGADLQRRQGTVLSDYFDLRIP